MLVAINMREKLTLTSDLMLYTNSNLRWRSMKAQTPRLIKESTRKDLYDPVSTDYKINTSYMGLRLHYQFLFIK